jgi:hypothetical protein
MRIHKLYIALGLLIALGMFFELTAHADEMNESTKITFSAPVQVPGRVLPAGSYLFEQAEPNGNPDVIQISNADRTVLYAIVQTASTGRKEASGDTAITLAEPDSGNPVLVKWFYPGRAIGHEFLYPKQQEQAIAQDKQETYVGGHLMPNSEAAGE